ncbi:MAG: cupin domain-containing protein [Balneolaceae bacterium]|nr:MAG: cupin domain-containing protein [Balneolaceae bacterium]
MTKKESAGNPAVTQNGDVEHPEVMKTDGAGQSVTVKMDAVPQPDTVKMDAVPQPDAAKNEIVLELEKEGKRYIFYGEPDSRAPAVEFRHVLGPGGDGPEPHIHTKQTETFHVISGAMLARVKGQEDVTLGPGEKIAVPPGIVHSFTNGSKDEALVLRIVVEPALDFQWFMSEAVKSGIRNGGSQKNMPLLEAGHLMWLSRDQQRIGGLPYFLQDILFGLLSLGARITGKAGNLAPKP